MLFHRITEHPSWKWTSKSLPAQAFVRKGTYMKISTTIFNCILKIFGNRDFSMSQRRWLQWINAFALKRKCIFLSVWNLSHFSLYPLPVVLSVWHLWRGSLHPLWSCHLSTGVLCLDPLQPQILQVVET